jgi:methyl-accepting chemotaxis protein
MDTSKLSPQAKEAYREFLLTRGPARARLLALTGMVASPLLFGLDLLHLHTHVAEGLTGAVVGRVALARLPWVLVPLVTWWLSRRVSLHRLPRVAFLATALFALGNDWAFYRLGMAGTGYHVVLVLLNVITGPSMLPLGRWGRLAFYALLALAHLGLDLVLVDAALGRMLVLDVGLLLGGTAVGMLMEALYRAHRNQFFLRQEVVQTLVALEESRGRIVHVGASLTTMATTLSSTIADLSQQAAHVRTAAQRIAAASEQMAASAGALLRHSRASATQAAEAQRYTGEVDGLVSGMETGLGEIAEAVGHSAQSVQRLEESSERIGGFVETIQEMAAATNMLALNAGIEAARAGEHGRGFAVVAREVSKLAEESGRSSAQIGAVVEEVTVQMAETLKAVGQIRETSQRFSPVLESARTTLRAIREIVLQNQQLMVKSSEEADRQAEQTVTISTGCARLLELVDAHAQMSADVAAAALQLSRMSEELKKLLPEEEQKPAAPAGPAEKKEGGEAEAPTRTRVVMV